MLNEFGYAEKIEELVKAGKADDSVLKTINDNEEEQKKTNENLDILLKKIEKLEKEMNEKKEERKQIPIYKIKELMQITKIINSLKKEYAQKMQEKTYMEDYCKQKIKQNSEIKEEISSQYTIYQENEIYIKAVEKTAEKNIELSTEFYAGYVNHMNEYMNLKYSIKENSKLKEPNVSDLTTLLSITRKTTKKVAEKEETPPEKKTSKKT